MQQDTLIEGTPVSIREVETFLANAFSQAATSLADSARDSARTSQDAWEGVSGTAFRTRLNKLRAAAEDVRDETATARTALTALADALESAHTTMDSARALARAGGLTVVGTVIYAPGPAPVIMADQMGTAAAQTALSTYQASVDAWNSAIAVADEAFLAWAEAVETFSTVAIAFPGSLATLTDGLITGASDVTKLAAKAHSLSALRELHLDTQARLLGHADAITPDGRLTSTKAHFYDLLNGADDAGAKVKAIDDVLNKHSGVRNAARVGKGVPVLGIAATGYGIWADMEAGESGGQAVVSNVGGAAIGMGAAIGTGALIGSFIAPPAGTIVGAGVGAIVGAAAGIFASGAIDHMWENASEGFVDTVNAGWKEITDTGEAIGDLASDAWGAIFG
ncbi:hypothetical protein [Demequina globuliformis]|uniref:hypothetical protein n=1 Tax=Demequina globuliformis TaxID=676202 RepID=UPI00078680B2|nr:hypothetical protein [Demequina globuliformis]